MLDFALLRRPGLPVQSSVDPHPAYSSVYFYACVRIRTRVRPKGSGTATSAWKAFRTRHPAGNIATPLLYTVVILRGVRQRCDQERTVLWGWDRRTPVPLVSPSIALTEFLLSVIVHLG